MGGAWLLRAGPQPEEMCRGGGVRTRRRVSGYRGRAEGAAGDRRLYGGGGGGDRVQPAGIRHGRQYRAGYLAALRDLDATACCQTVDEAEGGAADAGGPAGRFRP